MTTNYNPISVLSQVNKIFENSIYSRIFSYLEKFNLLNENQFGFRTKSCCSYAFVCIYDDISKDKRTSSIFLHLSKVFDTVNHHVLLQS